MGMGTLIFKKVVGYASSNMLMNINGKDHAGTFKSIMTGLNEVEGLNFLKNIGVTYVTRQKVILIGVNATSFRVVSFCLIIVNGRQLLCACGKNSFYFYYKECMGWRPCLFVCYGG
jgi:hypothetical protein